MKFKEAIQKVEGLTNFIEWFDIKTKRVNGHKYLVFYKKVRSDYGSIHLKWRRVKIDKNAYKPGNIVKCKEFNIDRHLGCGAGLHIGTWQFAKDFSFDYLPLMEVLVRPQDIVCVPHETSGKIRCKKLRVARRAPRG